MTLLMQQLGVASALRRLDERWSAELCLITQAFSPRFPPLSPLSHAQVTKERFAMMLSDMREKGATDEDLKEIITQENYDRYKKISSAMTQSQASPPHPLHTHTHTHTHTRARAAGSVAGCARNVSSCTLVYLRRICCRSVLPSHTPTHA